MFGRRFDLERLGEARKPFFSSRLFGRHVSGACDWSRAHTLTQMPEIEMSKFALAPHPLDAEGKKRKLEPTPEFKQKQIEAQRAVLGRAGSNIFKEVLAKTEAKELIEKIGDKVDEDYIHDFRNWIAGIGKRSDYVKGGVPLSSVGHGKPLSRDPTVINFIDKLTGRVIDYYAEIANMKMRGPGVGRRGGPATLNDLWLYFKYVVRNDPIDPRDFTEASTLKPDAALVGNEDGIIDSHAMAPSLADDVAAAPSNKRQTTEKMKRKAPEDAQEIKKAAPKEVAKHIAGKDGPETTLPVTDAAPASAPPAAAPATDPIPEAAPAPEKPALAKELEEAIEALTEAQLSEIESETGMRSKAELKEYARYFPEIAPRWLPGKARAEPVVPAAPDSAASMTRESDEPDTPIVRRTPMVIPPPGTAEHMPKEAPDTPMEQKSPIPPPPTLSGKLAEVQGPEVPPKQKSPIAPESSFNKLREVQGPEEPPKQKPPLAPESLFKKLHEVQGAEEPPRGKYPLPDEPTLDQRQTALLKASLQKISEDLLDAYENAKTPEEKARTDRLLNAALAEIKALEGIKKNGPDSVPVKRSPLKTDEPANVTVENQKTTAMGSLKWDMLGLKTKRIIEETRARLRAEDEARVRAADEAAHKKREDERQKAFEAAVGAQRAAEALERARKKVQDEATAKVKAAADAREKEAAENNKNAARAAEWAERRKTRPSKEASPLDYLNWIVEHQTEPGHPGYTSEESQEAEAARLAKISGVTDIISRWRGGQTDVPISSRAKKTLLSWLDGEGVGRFIPLNDDTRFDMAALMVPKLKESIDLIQAGAAPKEKLPDDVTLLVREWLAKGRAWPERTEDDKKGVPIGEHARRLLETLLQGGPARPPPAAAAAAPPPRPAAAKAPPAAEEPRRSDRKRTAPSATPAHEQAGYPSGDFQSKSANAFQEETAIMSQLVGQFFGARAKQSIKGGSEQQKQDYIYRASAEAQRAISKNPRISAAERAQVYMSIRQWIYKQVYE